MSEHSARAASQPSTRSTDEIVQHAFPTVRKGLDEGQVRGYLRRLAGDIEAAQRREGELRDRVAELEQRGTAVPELTPELLLQALGEETARVLRSAQEAAEDIRRRAEEHAATLVRDAHEEARAVRDETRTLVDDRTAEAQAAADAIQKDADARARETRATADAYAATTRQEAEHEAAGRTVAAQTAATELVAEAESQARQARSDADAYAATTRRSADETAAERLADATRRATAEVDGARNRGREMVAEAQAVRERMLGDLSRRKATAQARVDELRAGRDRLLEAYSIVRRTLEEATNALTHAEGPSERRAPSAGNESPVEAVGETIVGGIVFDVEVTGPLSAVPTDDATLDVTDDATDDATDPADDVAAVFEEPVLEEPTIDEADEADGPDQVAGAEVDEIAVDEPVAESDAPAETVAEPVAQTEPEESTDAPTDPVAEPEVVVELDAAPAPASRDDDRVLESGDPIDALFERLKTKRRHAPNGGNGRGSGAHHGNGPSARHTDQEPAPTVAGVALLDLPAEETRAGAEASTRVEPDVRGRDLALLTRRDEQVTPLVAALTRKVKRVLQDEQNELLSALRRAKKGVDLAVLPEAAARAAAVAAAAVPALADAHARGAGRTAGAPDDATAAAALADGLAGELLIPLRERLLGALAPGGTPSTDVAEAAERVSAQYREWKTERVEGAVHDALHAAWVQGTFATAPDGRTLRWVLDPLGTCPDCEDNALEPTPKGGAFPTGHAHPPAHPGCRCMIAAE